MDTRRDPRLLQLFEMAEKAESEEEYKKLSERISKRGKVLGIPDADLMAIMQGIEPIK